MQAQPAVSVVTSCEPCKEIELTGADGEPLIPLAALRSLLDQATPPGDIDDDFADTNVSPIFTRETA